MIKYLFYTTLWLLICLAYFICVIAYLFWDFRILKFSSFAGSNRYYCYDALISGFDTFENSKVRIKVKVGNPIILLNFLIKYGLKGEIVHMSKDNKESFSQRQDEIKKNI